MIHRLVARPVGQVAVAVGLIASMQLGAQASSTPGWRIVEIIGVKAGLSEMHSVAASSGLNAWAGGQMCPASCTSPTPAVQQWNGKSWRPFSLSSIPGIAGASADPVLTSSSPGNTWIFVLNSSSDVEYALFWNGARAKVTKFPAETSISAAVTFSRSDAWAFGTHGALGSSPAPYAAHYNGRTWARVSLPVLPSGVSAVSATDIWVYGQLPATSHFAFAVSRWNGRTWTTTMLPNLHLGTGFFLVPGNIAALRANDVWVDGTLGKGTGVGDGVVLLNWNGSTWTRVKTRFATSEYNSDMTQDGHGGIWVSGYSSMAQGYAGPYLYHYNNGSWTRQPVPTTKGDKPQMGGLTWIPGTRSVWGAGELLPGDGTSQGMLLKDGP